MKVEFLTEAQNELDDAIEFYNSDQGGLGKRFLEEILNTLDRIIKYPEAWHPLSGSIRRCQTRRFPFGIIYTVIEDLILVIAVSHLHRKPNYWQNRIE